MNNNENINSKSNEINKEKDKENTMEIANDKATNVKVVENEVNEDDYEDYEEEVEVNEETMEIIQTNILKSLSNLKKPSNDNDSNDIANKKSPPDIATFELLKKQVNFLELLLEGATEQLEHLNFIEDGEEPVEDGDDGIEYTNGIEDTNCIEDTNGIKDTNVTYENKDNIITNHDITTTNQTNELNKDKTVDMEINKAITEDLK